MKKKKQLNFHEGLSFNQAQVIVEGVNLSFRHFSNWLGGQTCPMVVRIDELGNRVMHLGVYEYDLIRYIKLKLFKVPTIWD